MDAVSTMCFLFLILNFYQLKLAYKGNASALLYCVIVLAMALNAYVVCSRLMS